MAKRKREVPSKVDDEARKGPKKKVKGGEKNLLPLTDGQGPLTIQIIAGSYDRVLHGVTVAVKPSPGEENWNVKFADTFLFNAHNSAIRCLALSPLSEPAPGQTQKVMLASGSTDERINLYNLSAHPPSTRATDEAAQLSTLTPRPVLENPKNRELGTLLHHSSSVTRLVFPTRSKLLSGAEDSTIGVTRTRDWSLLHTFKVPIPHVQGRPSGDTAALGGAPSGVNDFAVHPSMKIMISVSKGERCMRLWNLVTGKKARVLNFGRETLAEIGEGKHSTGEARRIVWGNVGGEDEFAVSFDRDILVYGMDCKPRCKVLGNSRTKIHELCYVKVDSDDNEEDAILAVSTEDGRVMFFSTRSKDLQQPEGTDEKTRGLPSAKLIAQLGGKDSGITGRIKDFTILPVSGDGGKRAWFVVTASSDGKLRVWKLESSDLENNKEAGRQVGRLLGSYESQNRITCVEAFIMIPRPDGAEDSEFEFGDDSDDAAEDDSEDE